MTEYELLKHSPINVGVALIIMLLGTIGVIGYLAGMNTHGTEWICVFLLGNTMYNGAKIDRLLGMHQRDQEPQP